ncbi:18S rRNA biogenesis protein RCL1 [Plasmodium fragile]|uniref:18S rRNA biogenesis protein RCL1 n=1 Tax=Plasmodium fragile TaxID=5857 RepID=A0A0D9QSZ9_PLAFR|nr:18S rRNA biogenesis protein RCL1 [Plasmodium fragile]KJP89982.1 18S rRNA biogenesis protein RCL1 [Plasmodium fragile]
MEFTGSNFLRFRLALSMISGKAITIKNIRTRKKQKTSGTDDHQGDGVEKEGLREYEAKLLKLIDKLCDDTTIKINEEGDELYFKPGFLMGNVNDEVRISDLDNTFHCGKERSITYFLEFLLMVTPFFKNPVKLTLKGITDDSIDTSVHTCKVVSEHFFKNILKLDDYFLNIKIVKRGIKSDCSGEVLFFMDNLKTVEPLDMNDPGVVKKITGTIVCNKISPVFRNKLMNFAKKNLLNFTPYVSIEVEDAKVKNFNSQNHFISFSLFAHTKNKCMYATDLCVDEFFLRHARGVLCSGGGSGEMDDQDESMSEEATDDEETNKPQRSSRTAELDKQNKTLHDADIYERLGFFIALKMMNEIKGLPSVDSNYQWLPLLYMALGNDLAVSKISLSIVKPYSIALIRLLRDFFSVVFDIKKVEKSPVDHSYLIKCVGIGYRNISKKTF